ncbi:MAG: fused MFS/spermidine synthase [Thermodesulfobacteriota bacterium]
MGTFAEWCGAIPFMSWMFFLFGLASLTGQILLLREILVIFHGTEISLGIFFSSWLLGIGIGASVGARVVKQSPGEPHGLFAHSFVLLGLSLVFHIVLIRLGPRLFGASPAELTALHGLLLAVPAGTFVTSFLTGFLFPVGCRCVRDAGGRSIGRLYAYEGLGGLAGGLAFTFFLARFVEPLHSAAIMCVCLAAGSIIYCLRQGIKSPLIGAVPFFLAAVVLLLPQSRVFSDWTVLSRWESLHPGLKLLESTPTPYQHVEIASLGKQFSLFGNGKIVASFPDPLTANRTVALVMAQRPDAQRVLLIGGGIGSLVRSFLEYPVDRLDVVEPDPWALETARTYLPPEEATALQDPRVHIIVSDGRLYANQLHEQMYDIIYCQVPDPVSSYWNRYYTVEFFRAASRALTTRGVLATSVTSAENFWGSEVASYAGSVYHTLLLVFPFVKGTPGDETLFFASSAPSVISLDPFTLKERYQTIGGGSFDPAGFDTLVPPKRTEFVEKELKASPVLINTDFDPISSSLAMILWGRFSGTGYLNVLNTIRSAGLVAFIIPILVFVLARVSFRVRWGPRGDKEARFQSLLAMAAIGAAAMGIQVVLIYSYQSLFGYVFERIGLLAGVFMAGLVTGGFGGGELVHRSRHTTAWLLTVLGLFAGLCLASPASLRLIADRACWLIETAVFGMVFVSGILTGVAFPLVASRHLKMTGDSGVTSGWTDAADHFGAALGAAVTGTLLVPLLGIEKACFVLALIVAVPGLLMGAELLFVRIESELTALRPRSLPSFPYQRFSWVLSFCVAGAFAWHVIIGPPGTEPQVRFPEETLKKVSGSENFRFEESPLPHYVGTSHGENGLTVSLSTMGAGAQVRGYGGPINLLVSVSDSGIIQGVAIAQSQETPAYMRGMDSWLEQFRGKSIVKPLHQEVDALTGATISCRAIVSSLEMTGRRIAGPLLGTSYNSGEDVRKQSLASFFLDARLWAVIGLMVFFVYAFYSRSRRIRTVCLVAALAILGLYLNAPFTSLDAAEIIRGSLPASGTMWRNAALISVLAISLLWGQAFCGFLCPFGALQELLSVERLRVRPSRAVERAGRYFKFVLLSVLVCLLLVTNDTIWFTFSPLQHFFGRHTADFFFGRMDWWVWVLCATVLVASVFYFRFWCRYLCPAGAILALFNKVSLLRRHSPQINPGRCDLGVCSLDDVDCIKCHRCLYPLSPMNRG